MVVKALRKHSAKPFDVHLMVTPVDPGAGLRRSRRRYDLVSIRKRTASASHDPAHQEPGQEGRPGAQSGDAACRRRAGRGDLDLVLVMSVNPGFGGQAFIESQLAKIANLRRMIDALGRKIDLEVDGGVNPETARRCIAAGADALVAGTAVFTGGPGRYAANIKALRS
jgi:ribulose-phosphate 3-epimerase